MATTEKLLTAEEFEQLPEDGKGYELIDGELREMAPTVNWHGEVEINLGTLLNVHVRPQGLGRVSCGEVLYIVRRNPDRVRAADIAFSARTVCRHLRHGSTLWRLSQTSWSRSSPRATPSKKSATRSMIGWRLVCRCSGSSIPSGAR